MGLAFILAGCDFSAKNLGKVTPLEDVPVTAIEIVANESYAGITAQLSVSYTPAVSNQKGVSWSISSGSTFATIDEGTGVLTILEGADNSEVTVKSASIYDPNVSATKTIRVTYTETVEELTAIAISGPDTIKNSGVYSVATTPFNSVFRDAAWSIISGAAFAIINENTGVVTALEGANASQVTIKAVSAHDPSLTATKAISVTYEESFWDLSGNVGYIALPALGNDWCLYLELAESASASDTGHLLCTSNPSVKAGYVYNFRIGILSKSNRPYYGAVQADGSVNGFADATSFSYAKKVLLTPDNVYLDGASKNLSAIESQVHDSDVNYLFFHASNQMAAWPVDLTQYSTNESLQAAIVASKHTIQARGQKVSKFILFARKKYTSSNDILANRATADIDLQFDADGNPFNAGTSGAKLIRTLN